jgi:hypothetical protein
LVTGLGPQRALAPTYAILVIAVAAVFYVLAHRVYPVTRLAGRAIIDGVGGTILGFAVGLLGVMELVAMFKFMTEGPWTFFDGMRVAIRAQIESTPFLPLIAQTFQVMQAFVDSFIPPH